RNDRTNDSAAVLHEPMATKPAEAVRLYKRPFRHRILRFLLLQRRTTTSSLFETEALAVEKPRSGLGFLCSADSLPSFWLDASCSRDLSPLPPSGDLKRAYLKEQILWRCFKCRTVSVARARLPCMPLTVTASAFLAWGNPMQKPALNQTECPHCDDSSSTALTSVDGGEDKGYEKLPPLDESVAAHLCPPTAIGRLRLSPDVPMPLYSMAVLQVFQAKLLAETDKSALDTATLTELRSATDLALRATKATAQAIGRSMASLVVLERHLWLTLTEIKDADKVLFLDAPVSPTGLFGPAVEGFGERFSAAQKTSQAMRHFLPKRSSSAAASGRPRSTPPQQPVKPVPAAATAASAQPAKPEPRQRSRSARRYPFQKRQGPRPKLVLDPAPPPSGGGKVSRLLDQPPEGLCYASKHPTCVLCKTCCEHWARSTCTHTTGVSPRHDGQPLEPILPLATRAEAWQAIPGVSEWVLGIIKRGYSFQFTRRPPRFSGVVPTLVVSKDAHVLRSEVMNLLEKGVVEVVHPAQSESGFYSRYFLVPKKDGGLRPILDLRLLNRALMKRPFKMITLKQILSHIHPGDWFFSLDLKDAYFHIQVAPHHRRFLRFAFEGVAYQYTVLPFGLSLAPRTFTKCMDAALSSLRQRGIRILNYLDDWLVLAQSEAELLSHRSLLLSHLECLGLKVNLAKSALHPSRRISFLGAVFDSTQMRAIVAPDRALAIQRLAASFKIGASHPLKMFQKMLGLMASASPVLKLGLLRMRPLQYWLKPRVPSHAWRHGRLRIKVDQACVEALIPWKNGWREVYPWVWSAGGRWSRQMLPTRVGELCAMANQQGFPAEAGIHINCLEMLAVCRALHFFLPDLKGHHVLVRSDSMTVVSYINRQGGLSSKRLFTLVKDLLEWAQLNLCSLRATHVPGRLNQGADMLSRSNVPSGESTLHPQTVQKIWEVFGKAEVDLFASEDNSHCPKYYSKDRDALAHDWPNLLLYAFPPTSLIAQVLKRVREQKHKLLLVAPLWRNQHWFSEL
ncbi:hypothetical protein M9458_003523, partial [Cirrhinus mrigala]